MKVLLIEDSSAVRNVLRMSLESESFAVDEAENGEQGLYMARINKYDLIILDNVMPKKMGREVCRELRESGFDTPILLLSAQADVLSKINLLNLGADDYLTKPFSFQELIARIRALMRRPHRIEDVVLQNAKVKLNTNTHETLVNNKKIYLTRKEFSMLELFMKNLGKVLSRATLLEHVWDSSIDPFSNTIESHVMNLRKKLGDKNRELIVSIPGRGYKMIDAKGS